MGVWPWAGGGGVAGGGGGGAGENEWQSPTRDGECFYFKDPLLIAHTCPTRAPKPDSS